MTCPAGASRVALRYRLTHTTTGVCPVFSAGLGSPGGLGNLGSATPAPRSMFSLLHARGLVLGIFLPTECSYRQRYLVAGLTRSPNLLLFWAPSPACALPSSRCERSDLLRVKVYYLPACLPAWHRPRHSSLTDYCFAHFLYLQRFLPLSLFATGVCAEVQVLICTCLSVAGVGHRFVAQGHYMFICDSRSLVNF